MPARQQALAVGQRCRITGDRTASTDLYSHGLAVGALVTLVEYVELSFDPSSWRVSIDGAPGTTRVVLPDDLEPITDEASTTCPCGGPAYRCECDCGPCIDARQALSEQEHQECSRCHQTLPAAAFSRRRSGGLQSWCRDCSAAHARDRRAGRTATPRPPTRRTATGAGRSPFDRPFGVEIEVIHPDPLEVRDCLRSVGLDCENEEYNHQTRPHWKIVPDGSVDHGFELVSPVLRGADGRRQVRLAHQALREAGASVDRTCGLHVHLEATDLPASAIAAIVRLWHAEQGVIDGLVAPSRRSVAYHTYCGPVSQDAVDRAEQVARAYGDRTLDRTAARSLGYERYQTLNLCSYAVHGTLEVRQHQGTLNATKALAWIQFCQALFARAIANPSAAPATGIRSLLVECESAGLDSTIAAYLQDRHDGFAGNRIAA